MSKLNEIIEGWKNYTFPTPKVEVEAKRRIGICVKCTKLSETNFCTLCGCYMPAKARSLKSKCKLKKW